MKGPIERISKSFGQIIIHISDTQKEREKEKERDDL